MVATPAYRDPLLSAVARVEQLEREKAELLELTKGARRSRSRRRFAFVIALVAAPVLAWFARGVVPSSRPTEFEGRYTFHDWRTSASGSLSGPMSITIDPWTGKGHGLATGAIGKVRISAQLRDHDLDMLMYGEDGESLGFGTAHMVGDAISGNIGVPKQSGSAEFVVEGKRR